MPQNSHECNNGKWNIELMFIIHTHTQVLQLTSDIEGVHHELAMGAERHSDLRQKSEGQLRQLQVSLFSYVCIYSNMPYLEDVSVAMATHWLVTN